MILRQWLSSSRCFEGTYCLYPEGFIGLTPFHASFRKVSVETENSFMKPTLLKSVMVVSFEIRIIQLPGVWCQVASRGGGEDTTGLRVWITYLDNNAVMGQLKHSLPHFLSNKPCLRVRIAEKRRFSTLHMQNTITHRTRMCLVNRK